jgi:hypothetical protein
MDCLKRESGSTGRAREIQSGEMWRGSRSRRKKQFHPERASDDGLLESGITAIWMDSESATGRGA